LAGAACVGTTTAVNAPIYQSVDEIVRLLDDSEFSCSEIDVYSTEAVRDVARSTPGVLGIAECGEGLSNHPELAGYAALVFDSQSSRRLSLIGLLAWACMQTSTFPYAYGPNWLLVPADDRTELSPVEQAADVVSGVPTSADCDVFWNAPDDTHDEMDPADLDIAWFRAATGEIEFPAVSEDLFPAAP
jgi:hypothetical protein